MVRLARRHEPTGSRASRTFSISAPCHTAVLEPIDEIWLIYLIATVPIVCNPKITTADQRNVIWLARVEERSIPAGQTRAITRTVARDSVRLGERGLVGSAAPTGGHNLAVAFVFHQDRYDVVERMAQCSYAAGGRETRLNNSGGCY